ncbi:MULTISPECIES: response regulator FixJ [unclassified Caulobacter]|uniref:response regulator FixJ n=1 Tax=unclassified Caulobacter TaxID=2648921 RepID=UPI000D38C3D4|nr:MULTISPECIES: response regulator FixJ [unclassified Caulobacter]PTS89154.1 DNA-binding response regulator [Caulobacter sp. HMWF009]PTT07151.1 DNA-binding response regulator [Caulobacter sp. HMWF025]
MTDAVVYVVDDDESARESLAFLLESADLQVETFASAPAFLAGLSQARPGCIITDVRMPEMSGQDLVARLAALDCHLPVIMITGHGDIPMAVEAMRSGVVDFIEKPFSESRILDALKRALSVLSSAPAVSGDQAAILQRLETLSERERQVLDGVVAGHPNKVIARDLGISPRTVEIYRAKLMTKMHADNLAALVRMTLAVRG